MVCMVVKCLCVISRSKAHDFFSSHQCGVACPSGAEKMVHGLRCCVDEHWTDGDFAVLKIIITNYYLIKDTL